MLNELICSCVKNSFFYQIDFHFELPPKGDQGGSVGVLICKQNLILILAVSSKNRFISRAFGLMAAGTQQINWMLGGQAWKQQKIR